PPPATTPPPATKTPDTKTPVVKTPVTTKVPAVAKTETKQPITPKAEESPAVLASNEKEKEKTMVLFFGIIVGVISAYLGFQ
ncbi:TPA: hypothetical protein DCX66_00315, partial [Candidatus Nomurabacteria bacterium]|nr:hypothetical protein [Candidatus Nomurabacteria bacterium]HCU01709.1 hypothetical protein [Candidatus Nomurabacteria bacterium]